MKPTVGRIVHYKLTAEDAEKINRRRTSGASIFERIKANVWPLGAQAHIGNEAHEGEIFPMFVCRVWPNEYPGEAEGHRDGVNGQVFLDGNDTLWVTSIAEDYETSERPAGMFGRWTWPPRG